MPRVARHPVAAEHKPENALDAPGEITRFYERCSDRMRQLLDELANEPDQPRNFRDVERVLGWPRLRIASVLGGVWHLRTSEFGGRRPYRLRDDSVSTSGRRVIWCDAVQAAAIRAARER